MRSRAIFRESAVQRYIQRREKDILPRLLRPPVFIFLWILLILGLLAGLVAWNIRVPVYTGAPGVMLPDKVAGHLEALLFVPENQQFTVRPGQAVILQIGASGPRLQQTITSVTAQALSPVQIRTNYALTNSLGLVVSQPSLVAVVVFPTNPAFQGYAGSLVGANIQIGTRSALSLLPVLFQYPQADRNQASARALLPCIRIQEKVEKCKSLTRGA